MLLSLKVAIINTLKFTKIYFLRKQEKCHVKFLVVKNNRWKILIYFTLLLYNKLGNIKYANLTSFFNPKFKRHNKGNCLPFLPSLLSPFLLPLSNWHCLSLSLCHTHTHTQTLFPSPCKVNNFVLVFS